MCSSLVKEIINYYIQYTEWCGNYSEKFMPLNGVKQGSILSTALSNIYLDELLIRLKLNDVGCHIGNQFAGALCLRR